MIEYESRRCFEGAERRVANARIAGDSNPSKSIISDMENLKGNFYYAKTATNKEKNFTKVEYFSDIT